MQPKEFKNRKGQVVGTLKDGIYRKRVDSRKHKLRVMNAYGIDEPIVWELEKCGCIEIRILETDKNNVLAIPFDQFVKLGVHRSLDGAQVFLPVHYFQIKKYESI